MEWPFLGDPELRISTASVLKGEGSIWVPLSRKGYLICLLLELVCACGLAHLYTGVGSSDFADLGTSSGRRSSPAPDAARRSCSDVAASRPPSPVGNSDEETRSPQPP